MSPKNTLIPQESGLLAPPVAEQSVRFSNSNSASISGYLPGASSESDAWTVSCWVRRTRSGLGGVVFGAYIDASNFTEFRILGDAINFRGRIAGVDEASFTTSGIFRDLTAWYHFYLLFDRLTGTLELYINGEIYLQYSAAPVIANVAGYAWLDSTADHFLGDDNVGAQAGDHNIADFHCVGGSAPGIPDPAFGSFNSIGTWQHTAYAGGHGTHGFFLSFGRTVDLGEDFSGNNNDFSTLTNISGSDQSDDWPERFYAILDQHDTRTTGLTINGGLTIGGGTAHVTMRPRQGSGVYYYERNGVAVTFDTVGGAFDPALDAATYNFGQFPFVDVGPSGGEKTVCSPNLPASLILDSRDNHASINYIGNLVNPRSISAGDRGPTPHRDITFEPDLIWSKNQSIAIEAWQAHRLRGLPNQLNIEDSDLEVTTDAEGDYTAFEALGYEVDAGGTNNDNFNDNTSFHSGHVWKVEEYAQNLFVTADEDDAEEEVATGTMDVTSSDLELVREGASPQLVGMRFNNLLIPQGATILEARIQFTVDETDAGVDDMEIFCEAVDDAPLFTAANSDISNRTLTGASTLWSPPDWLVVGDRLDAQRTPTFHLAVKEVIDRGGWAEGNSLVVIIIGDAAGTPGERTAESFDGDADFCPELQLKWRNPGVINISQVSLFQYRGTGGVRQFMHGLNVLPELLITKNLDAVGSFQLYCSLIQDALPAPEDGVLEPDLGGAAIDDVTKWNDTAPSGTFMTTGTNAETNALTDEFAGWAMASLDGYSKVFRYVGTGIDPGPQVYCGFKPRFLVVKQANGATPWPTHSRIAGALPGAGDFNPMSGNWFINLVDSAVGTDTIDVYASGFKVRNAGANMNAIGQEYIGWAFAETPFESAKAAL